MKKIETVEHLFLYPTDIYINSTSYYGGTGYIGFTFPKHIKKIENFMDNSMLEQYWFKHFNTFGWTNDKDWWESQQNGFIKIK